MLKNVDTYTLIYLSKRSGPFWPLFFENLFFTYDKYISKMEMPRLIQQSRENFNTIKSMSDRYTNDVVFERALNRVA